jgi:hypothetical protein
MPCFYISCLNMAAPLSNCTVVGGQDMSLFFLFSEDVKRMKFVGVADDSQKVQRFAVQRVSCIPR